MTEVRSAPALIAAGLLALAIAVGEVDGDRWFDTDHGDHLGLLFVVALLSTAAYVVASMSGPRVRMRRVSPGWWGVGLLGWLGVAALFSPEPVVAVVVALGLAAMAAAAARLVVLGGWVLLAWTVLAAFVVFAGASLTVDGLDLRVDGRLQLLSLDANQLGRFSSLVVLAGVVLASQRSWTERVIGAGAFVVGLLATVDSSSRTALAALGVALVLVAWQRFDRVLVVVATVVGVLCLALVSPAALEDGATAMLGRDVATEDVGSLAGRTEAWQAAADVAVDHPLVGLGPGYDDEAFLAARIDGTVGWEARNAHSLAGHLVVVGGVPALLLALGALGAYLAAALRRPLPLVDSFVLFLVIDGVSEAMIAQPNSAVAALAGAAAVRSLWVVAPPAWSPTARNPLVEVR
ncbi:MAG: O-antigen ligase family protein [Acidimicrobiales bacterium]